ncbi:Gag-polypeptide of LTR copia-type [Sesbania bispinosa]|nr:Gag-polypeptide of LTR copia-type [Sesbania bispinosa]
MALERKDQGPDNEMGKKITASSPFYLSPSDNPGTPLVVVPLKGDNYRNWARSMKTALRAKMKLGFVDGMIKKPLTTSPEYHAWERTDSMPNMSITKYYNKFKSLTDELGEMQPLSECTCGASKEITKRDEEHHVHLFLGGLDADKFAQIKGTILNIDPFPSLKRVFNHILREKSQILIDRSREVKVDIGAAFHVKNASWHKTKDEPKIKCDHCGKIGHEKAKCFELIGYPLNWENRRSKRQIKLNSGVAKFAWSGQRSFPDAEQSHALCGSQGKERDEQHNFMFDNTHNTHKWVLDSGASHHMTPLFSILKNLCDLKEPICAEDADEWNFIDNNFKGF